MITVTNESKHINDIISSSTFKSGSRYVKLLRYLYDAHCKGEKPKELSIAVDVFGRNYDFDCTEDTLVRVSVYNLRKKLKQYYQEDGKNSRMRISIPKGGYALQIDERKRLPNYWFVGVILSVIVVSFILFVSLRSSTFQKVWNPVVKNNRNTIVALGEHYFFNKHDSDFDKDVVVRVTSVNSESKLRQYVDANELEVQTSQLDDNRYIGQNILEPFRSLCYSFGQHDMSLGYRFISDLSVQDFHDSNIIFVGEYKTSGILSNYLSKNGVVDLDNKGIYFEGLKDTLSPSVHTDICFVSKRINREGTAFYMVSSVHDTGMYRGISYLTNSLYLEEFEILCMQKFGYIPDGFNLLVEVKGINRVGLSSKLLYIEERKDDFEL